MHTIDDKIRKLVMESFDLTIKTSLDAFNGECSAEDVVKRYSGFLADVKGLFTDAGVSCLSSVDGTTLSENLRDMGIQLVKHNTREQALEAYDYSFSVLSLIDPKGMSRDDMAALLYESIDSSIQALMEAESIELVDAIYEAALNCPLARDPGVREGISQLRSHGVTNLPKPSWENDEDDDDMPSIIEYHEGKGNVPSTIPIETPVPFDEHAFSEGMRQALGIHDRPIIAADIDTVTDLELQGFGIRFACDLAFMPRLRFLNLASNAISDVQYIAELHEVEMLNLGGNQIEDLTTLAGMRSLTALDLSDNAIIDVGPLAELTSLKDLNLDNNHIRFISPFRTLANLETLSIAGNPLVDSDRLLELPALQLLYVSREQVDEATIEKLRGQGVQLVFREKPIADAN